MHNFLQIFSNWTLFTTFLIQSINPLSIQGYLQYQIYNPDLRWSQIFGALEEHARDFGVVDYSVSQTSLEQVILF